MPRLWGLGDSRIFVSCPLSLTADEIFTSHGCHFSVNAKEVGAWRVFRFGTSGGSESLKHFNFDKISKNKH